MVFFGKKYPHTIQQSELDCGVAAVSSLLKYYKHKTSVIALQKELYVENEGTNIKDIYSFFESIKAKPKIFEKMYDNYDDVDLNEFFPCIALIDNDDSIHHYVVIYKQNKNRVLISDPAKNRVGYVSANIFSKIIYLIKLTAPENIQLKDSVKQTESNKVLSILFSIHKKNLIGIVFISIIVTIFSVFSSYYLGLIIDYVIPSENRLKDLSLLTFIFSLVVILQVLLNYIKGLFVIKVSKKVEKHIVSTYMNHIVKSKYNTYSNMNIGEYVSRLNDSLSIVDIFSRVSINIFTNIIYIFISIFVIFWLNPVLFFLCLIVIFLITFNVKLFFSTIYRLNEQTMIQYSTFNSLIINILRGLHSLKTLSLERFYLNKIEKQLNNAISKSIKLNKKILLSTSIQQLFSLLGNIFIIYLGVYILFSGELTLGKLTIIIGIVSYLISSVNAVSGEQFDIEKFIVGYNRMNYIFSTNILEDNNDLMTLETTIQQIEFRQFSLKPQSTYLLQKIDLKISTPHPTICIYGDSGIGKSTFVKTLIKFEDQYTGELLINNIDIREIDTQEIRKRIIYLSNYEYLMDTTIMENLCNDKKISYEEIYKVCSDFQILDFILSLPKQFNQKLLYGGENLSSGQIQRLALVRAVLRKPEVLILDESLANIDKKNKDYIIKKLEEYPFLKIYISHQELNIPKARKYVIKNKKIEIL